MKKSICLLLALCFVLICAACTVNSTTENTSDSNSQAQSTSAENTTAQPSSDENASSSATESVQTSNTPLATSPTSFRPPSDTSVHESLSVPIYETFTSVSTTLSTEIFATNEMDGKTEVSEDAGEKITVFFHCKENIDLSGIEVTLQRRGDDFGKMPLTAVSDSEGKVSFEKPDCDVMVKANYRTLPAGMGIKKANYITLEDNQNVVHIEVYPIDSVEPVFERPNSPLNFNLKNNEYGYVAAKKTIVSQNLTMVESPSETEGRVNCTMTYTGEVSVGDVLYPYTISMEYRDLDSVQYQILLMKYGLENEIDPEPEPGMTY